MKKMEDMSKEDGGDEWKEGGEEERRDEKEEREAKGAPVNKERKKQGHLVPASVLIPNTLVPC